MPFVPVPNTVLVELRYLYDSQHCENTLWFETTVAPVASTMLALLNDIETWWNASYAPQCVVALELVELVCTDQSSSTGPQVSFSPAVTTLGTQNTPGLPGNDSLTVSFRTALRGRSFRGRNYVIGIPKSSVNLATVDAGYISAWETAYNDLPFAITSTGYQWVVASRFSGINPTTNKPIPRVTGVTTPVTNAAVVDPIVDSQRRRLPGRGN